MPDPDEEGVVQSPCERSFPEQVPLLKKEDASDSAYGSGTDVPPDFFKHQWPLSKYQYAKEFRKRCDAECMPLLHGQKVQVDDKYAADLKMGILPGQDKEPYGPMPSSLNSKHPPGIKWNRCVVMLQNQWTRKEALASAAVMEQANPTGPKNATKLGEVARGAADKNADYVTTVKSSASHAVANQKTAYETTSDADKKAAYGTTEEATPYETKEEPASYASADKKAAYGTTEEAKPGEPKEEPASYASADKKVAYETTKESKPGEPKEVSAYDALANTGGYDKAKEPKPYETKEETYKAKHTDAEKEIAADAAADKNEIESFGSDLQQAESLTEYLAESLGSDLKQAEGLEREETEVMQDPSPNLTLGDKIHATSRHLLAFQPVATSATHLDMQLLSPLFAMVLLLVGMVWRRSH